jgi:hypothetical protein
MSWRTVGRACERVVASGLDPDRLDGLFRIGVDEISWRKHHKYLTLVVDHDRGCVVWGAEGKNAKTLDGFFDELGPQPAGLIEAVSMDLGPAFLKSVIAPGHAPQALVCADVSHLVKLVGDALDEVRRDLWQQLRRFPDNRYAKAFKGSRWALLKNPEDLTDTQAAQLAKMKRSRGGIWWAYEMKEQFRTIFGAGLEPAASIALLDRWITRALRSRLEPFTKAARTTRDPATDHHQRNRATNQQRLRRRHERQSPPDHPPRLRLPLSNSSTRPRHARLRPHQPHPAPRNPPPTRGKTHTTGAPPEHRDRTTPSSTADPATFRLFGVASENTDSREIRSRWHGCGSCGSLFKCKLRR